MAEDLGRAEIVPRSKPRRARFRCDAAEVLRARHVSVSERRRAARRTSRGIHRHGHRRPLQTKDRDSTCFTRWAGTPSGCPPNNTRSRPAEHPRVTTERNVGSFRAQLKRLGFAYDWEREVNTTDPEYYKWTQWIFLQLYHSWFNPASNKAEPIANYTAARTRTAFVSPMLPIVPVRWCPQLGTVLANEEVVDGKSEVGGFPVERRPMRQWMLRITAFAQRLIDELEGLDWPDGIKARQRDWIGRSEGAEVDFQLVGPDPEPGSTDDGTIKRCPAIRVFTTRPDTLYGATYMVLAPEHPLVDAITTPEQRDAVAAYQASGREQDRPRARRSQGEDRRLDRRLCDQSGQRRSGFPIWIADYVLMGYGTGAIMAVPAHDERDWEFARSSGCRSAKSCPRNVQARPRRRHRARSRTARVPVSSATASP